MFKIKLRILIHFAGGKNTKDVQKRETKTIKIHDIFSHCCYYMCKYIILME